MSKKQVAFIIAIIFIATIVGYRIGYTLIPKVKPEVITVVEEHIVEIPVPTVCPEPIIKEIECLPCIQGNTSVVSKSELDKVVDMNKRLADRLKTQYSKDPQTKSWSKVCLPDEYECLLELTNYPE